MSLSKLILGSDIGFRSFLGKERNIPESDGFSRGKLEDNDESFYIVYNQPDFADYAPSSVDDESGMEIFDTDIEAKFIRFNIRSLQGFDKTGIVVFEHQYYNGTGINYTKSDPDISTAFPTMQESGASSFIVSKGVWSLYTEPNYNGVKLSFEGTSEFGPGMRIQIPRNTAPDNRIRSVRYIREN